MSVRILHPNSGDWLLWKGLRLEAVQTNPNAFDSTLAELLATSDEQYQQQLIDDTIFGAFINDELVGCMGFHTGTIAKQKHRGEIFSVFLKTVFRGKGIGKRLLNLYKQKENMSSNSISVLV